MASSPKTEISRVAGPIQDHKKKERLHRERKSGRVGQTRTSDLGVRIAFERRHVRPPSRDTRQIGPTPGISKILHSVDRRNDANIRPYAATEAEVSCHPPQRRVSDKDRHAGRGRFVSGDRISFLIGTKFPAKKPEFHRSARQERLIPTVSWADSFGIPFFG